MDIEKIKKIAAKIEKDLEKKYHEINTFATNSGFELQNNLINLLEFIISSNSHIYSSRLGIDILEIIKAEFNFQAQQKEMIDNIMRNKGLTIEESTKVYEILLEIVDDFSNEKISDLVKKYPLFDPNFQILESLYAHFFISICTYLDLYTMKIFKEIIPTLEGKILKDFNKKFNPFKNPKERLNDINRTFDFYNENELEKEVIIVKSWVTILNSIVEIRNTISHENPLITYENLKEYFPDILKDANDEIQKNLENIDEKEKAFVKIIEPLLPGLSVNILFLLIIKNCIGYLSLYDNMIQKDLLSND